MALIMETKGIEPSTSWLQTRRSPIIRRRPYVVLGSIAIAFVADGARKRTRPDGQLVDRLVHAFDDQHLEAEMIFVGGMNVHLQVHEPALERLCHQFHRIVRLVLNKFMYMIPCVDPNRQVAGRRMNLQLLRSVSQGDPQRRAKA
jgi:hypothetical protein